MKSYVFALAPILCFSAAFGQVTLKQSHQQILYGSNEEPGERAGVEEDDRALPAAVVGVQQQQTAYQSFLLLSKLPGGKKTNWQEIGPITPVVSGPATYTGRPTVTAGRITALALSPSCSETDCKIFAGAAGGAHKRIGAAGRHRKGDRPPHARTGNAADDDLQTRRRPDCSHDEPFHSSRSYSPGARAGLLRRIFRQGPGQA